MKMLSEKVGLDYISIGSPLSKATCCTYKHGLVSVTRKVSLSSVPANDLLSCGIKKSTPTLTVTKQAMY